MKFVGVWVWVCECLSLWVCDCVCGGICELWPKMNVGCSATKKEEECVWVKNYKSVCVPRLISRTAANISVQLSAICRTYTTAADVAEQIQLHPPLCLLLTAAAVGYAACTCAVTESIEPRRNRQNGCDRNPPRRWRRWELKWWEMERIYIFLFSNLKCIYLRNVALPPVAAMTMWTR